MSYDLLIQRRIEEIEEMLLGYEDPIEKLYVWFDFIRNFSKEAHGLFDCQYDEFIKLCEKYVKIPDPSARKAIREQIMACALEIDNFSNQMKKIPRIQAELEKALLRADYAPKEDRSQF